MATPTELIATARELCAEVPATSIDRSQRACALLPQLADALEEAAGETKLVRKLLGEAVRNVSSTAESMARGGLEAAENHIKELRRERDDARAELKRLQVRTIENAVACDDCCELTWGVDSSGLCAHCVATGGA